METNQNFEVDLNFISSREYIGKTSDYNHQLEYVNVVTSMLSSEGLFLFEEDIVNRFNNLSFSEILQQNENFVQGHNRHNPARQGKLCPTYYDTWMSLTITPDKSYYPFFFAHLLKHTDLLMIDECMAYQLKKYHANDFTTFSRLLLLMLRKFEGVVIPEKIMITIQEWMDVKAEQQKKEEGESDDPTSSGKKRGRINRRAEDNITSLNREQTILLIQYLKQAGVFLRDEYLTDLDAGKAFELLTGFSQNTLRQDLGKFYQFQNKENLKRLQQVLSQVTHQIDALMK
jgi:hypothetical protein